MNCVCSLFSLPNKPKMLGPPILEGGGGREPYSEVLPSGSWSGSVTGPLPGASPWPRRSSSGVSVALRMLYSPTESKPLDLAARFLGCTSGSLGQAGSLTAPAASGGGRSRLGGIASGGRARYSVTEPRPASQPRPPKKFFIIICSQECTF